jgi:hypothetical protein
VVQQRGPYYSVLHLEPFLSLRRGGGVFQRELPQIVTEILLDEYRGLCVPDWMLSLLMPVLGEMVTVTWRHSVDSKEVKRVMA